MGITNLEKIDLIESKIINLDIHISILSDDLASNPEEDVEGKPSRQSVLEEFQLKKQALILERQALTIQG